MVFAPVYTHIKSVLFYASFLDTRAVSMEELDNVWKEYLELEADILQLQAFLLCDQDDDPGLTPYEFFQCEVSQ